VLLKETANLYFIVLGLTRTGIEFKIFHTRGEHATIVEATS